LELRVRGRNKGVAVRTVLSEEGEDVVAAYLGDDRTDEDAFVAIERRGLGVLVRDQYRPTAASHWLRPPEELLDFLIRWANARQSVVGNTENNKENNAETNNENNAKNNAQNDTPPEPRTGR